MSPQLTLKADEETMTVDLPDDWVNYWDANPQRHGGLFTTFDSDGLRAIETRPPQTLPDDMTEHEHLVCERYLYYADELDHTGDSSTAVNMLADEIAGLHKTDSVVQAAVDGRLPAALAWASTRFHARHERWIADERYSDTLQTDYNVGREVLPGND